MSEEDSKMGALLRWGLQLGISDSPSTNASMSKAFLSCMGQSLAVSYFSEYGGRGLAACRNLRAGELILRVPRAALLTVQSVLEDEKLAISINRHHHLLSTQKLIICLLAEVAKGMASWWYPYLVLLPLSYDTLQNFHEFELHALQVEDAIWVSKKAVLKARSEWKESLIVMQEMKLKPQLLTFRSWLWASSTISSRTLHIPWDYAGCLCPVGDLFNYAAPGDNRCAKLPHFDKHEEKELAEFTDSCTESHTQRLTDGGYEENSASYCFYANRNYKKGEQVLLSYGTYTNVDLLEHYGFLLSSNPNDKLFLQLDMDVNISTAWPKDSIYILPDGRPSFSLLCTLRLGLTPRSLRRALGHLAYAGVSLSTKNEVLVMKKLANQCSKALEELPTTMEDDASILVAISQMREFKACLGDTKLAFCKAEFDGFLEANGLQRGSMLEDTLLTTKALRGLERWRLAVHWRLCYKKSLSNCISYCNAMIGEIL